MLSPLLCLYAALTGARQELVAIPLTLRRRVTRDQVEVILANHGLSGLVVAEEGGYLRIGQVRAWHGREWADGLADHMQLARRGELARLRSLGESADGWELVAHIPDPPPGEKRRPGGREPAAPKQYQKWKPGKVGANPSSSG